MDVSDFFFFGSREGRRSPKRWEGGGDIFFSIGNRVGGGRGARRVFAGNLGGGGGAKYFFSGPKCPPRFAGPEKLGLARKVLQNLWGSSGPFLQKAVLLSETFCVGKSSRGKSIGATRPRDSERGICL